MHAGELQHADDGAEGLRQGHAHRPRLHQQHCHPPSGGQCIQGETFLTILLCELWRFTLKGQSPRDFRCWFFSLTKQLLLVLLEIS